MTQQTASFLDILHKQNYVVISSHNIILFQYSHLNFNRRVMYTVNGAYLYSRHFYVSHLRNNNIKHHNDITHVLGLPAFLIYIKEILVR